MTKKIQKKAQNMFKVHDISYCGEIVRRSDPDRFLLSMFLPKHLREDVWAVFAFNYEIAKTREVVSEKTLGLIRLQWWRDEIAAIYAGQGTMAGHEILGPLARVIDQYGLEKSLFDQMLDARELDLDDDTIPGNLEGLLNYAEFTTLPLYELVLRICGVEPDQEILQSIVVNYALVGVLRASAGLLAQGRCLFPEDLMQKHGLVRSELLSLDKRESLKALVKDIVTDGRFTLVGSKQVFLRANEALSGIYFKQLKRLNYDVMSPLLHREPAFKVFRVLVNVMF